MLLGSPLACYDFCLDLDVLLNLCQLSSALYGWATFALFEWTTTYGHYKIWLSLQPDFRFSFYDFHSTPYCLNVHYVLSPIRLTVLFQMIILCFELMIVTVLLKSEDIHQFRLKGSSGYKNFGFCCVYSTKYAYLRLVMLALNNVRCLLNIRYSTVILSTAQLALVQYSWS